MLAIGGTWHIAQNLTVLAAFNPLHGVSFLFSHGYIGLLTLGAVFLVVTGVEALYADLGHFGRGPIKMAWLTVCLPALTLNYLGQGALLLATPAAIENPFFLLYPQWTLLPMVVLATAATVIASQAVISGAYSLTRQAVQLGLLPRLDIRHTSEAQFGQIYIPRVNTLLLIGVVLLVVQFRSSGALASAYGIAVTGTMVVTAALAMVMVVMLTWRRGARILAIKTRRLETPIDSLIQSLDRKQPYKVPGTAVFLTADPSSAPTALLHSLKHYKVLHEQNVVLTIIIESTPRVAAADRVTLEPLGKIFTRILIRFGFMETPNIPKALALARKRGLSFDIMSTSFFLSRRAVRPDPKSGMPVWQDRLFIILAKNADDASSYFHLPTDRVVEIGTQVTV